MQRALVIFLALAAATSGRAVDMRLLIPLYNYPQWYAPTNYIWDDVAREGTNVPITVIVDPASGPGPGFPNVDYDHALSEMSAGSVTLLGYVDTAFGTRPASNVIEDVAVYATEPRVHGIFLDQALADAGHFGYYTNIYAAIHGHSNLAEVVMNSGPALEEDYLSAPATDVAMIFEQSVGWPEYQPPAHQFKYPPNRFSMLVHTCATADEMAAHLARAAQRNVVHVYVTDAGMPNPWDRLPTYWTQLVSQVKAYRELASTAVTRSSGIVAQFSTVPGRACVGEVNEGSDWTAMGLPTAPTGSSVAISYTGTAATAAIRLRLVPP